MEPARRGCEGVDFLTGSTAAEVPGEAAGVGCLGRLIPQAIDVGVRSGSGSRQRRIDLRRGRRAPRLDFLLLDVAGAISTAAQLMAEACFRCGNARVSIGGQYQFVVSQVSGSLVHAVLFFPVHCSPFTIHRFLNGAGRLCFAWAAGSQQPIPGAESLASGAVLYFLRSDGQNRRPEFRWCVPASRLRSQHLFSLPDSYHCAFAARSDCYVAV